MMSFPLEEIVAAIESGSPVSNRAVKQWMESEEIEVLGAVCHLITTAYERIDPALGFEEVQAFVLRYVERCLRDNPDGDWADNRGEAGLFLVSRYSDLWNNRSLRNQVFPELKEWLARLCREDDPEWQLRVVHSVLEHLLEEPEIADYFSDWQFDPDLKGAYNQAMAWAKHNPRFIASLTERLQSAET